MTEANAAAEIKAFIARNFVPGESPALAAPIDRDNFTFIHRKWRSAVMPHTDAPREILKKKYALCGRDFFPAEMNADDNGTPEVEDDRVANDFYITFDVNSPTPYMVKRKNEDLEMLPMCKCCQWPIPITNWGNGQIGDWQHWNWQHFLMR